MIDCLFLDSDDQRYFPARVRRVIHGLAANAEPEIRSALPMLPTTIELAAQTGTRVIPEIGCAGTAVSPNRVMWVVVPSRPGGIAAVPKTWLCATLAHECHHLARGCIKMSSKQGRGLVDAVVSEGLATAFQCDVSGRTPPWGSYPEQVEGWVQELLELQADAPYYHWMFQHPDGRRWIGYKAGTYIANQASRATGHTAAELVSTPTAEILRMAGFNAG